MIPSLGVREQAASEWRRVEDDAVPPQNIYHMWIRYWDRAWLVEAIVYFPTDGHVIRHCEDDYAIVLGEHATLPAAEAHLSQLQLRVSTAVKNDRAQR